MQGHELRNAVLEIGTEEMPARLMRQTIDDAKATTSQLLRDARLGVGEVLAYGTPRRITVFLRGVSPVQPDLDRELRGPAARAAFGPDGAPTRAAEGFARSAGVAVADLVRRDTPQGEYVFARTTERGRSADAVLAEVFPQVIASLSFPKPMRWGSNDYRFVRPIRWILCLLGADVICFNYHDIESGRITMGHRTLAPGPAEIAAADEYILRLPELGIMLDPEDRSRSIQEQAMAIAAEHGGRVVIDSDLLEEVTFIVEWPTAFAGSFSGEYLALPEACVITPMKDHQRYFPVRDADGALMPLFIAVRNGGDRQIDTVRAGNERVLAARLADAKFFYDDDMRRPLSDRLDDLKGVEFQERLGTMYDKTARVVALVRELLPDPAGREVAERAAVLCKADLVTAMVREFTELQGVMGREYSLRQGERPEVAQAIYEQYLPRFAGDELPSSKAGAAISIADKMDTIVGYFGIGLIPSGSADPYALRRQAAGALAVHAEWKFQIGLDSLAVAAAQNYAEAGVSSKPVDKIVADVMEFLRARLRVSLEESGIRYDIADAVLALGVSYPASVFERAKAVESVVDEQWFASIATAASRIRNIATNAETDQFAPELFQDPAESALYDAVRALECDIKPTILGPARCGYVDSKAYVSALERMSVISDTIDAYFESVMVMAPEEALRRNRTGMLRWAQRVLFSIVDFSKIVFAGNGN